MDVETHMPRRARGLTLIELTVTLTVAVVSVALLAPAWSELTRQSRITTAANQLLTQLRFARNAAVNRNARVGLCPSDDGAACSGDPRGWQRGYLVFLDEDRDRRRGADEPLLLVQQAHAADLRVHSTAGRPAVIFTGDGAAWGTNTTFRICGGDTTTANRAVVLYGSGRARVDRLAPGGVPITCS